MCEMRHYAQGGKGTDNFSDGFFCSRSRDCLDGGFGVSVRSVGEVGRRVLWPASALVGEIGLEPTNLTDVN